MILLLFLFFTEAAELGYHTNDFNYNYIEIFFAHCVHFSLIYSEILFEKQNRKIKISIKHMY